MMRSRSARASPPSAELPSSEHGSTTPPVSRSGTDGGRVTTPRRMGLEAHTWMLGGVGIGNVPMIARWGQRRVLWPPDWSNGGVIQSGYRCDPIRYPWPRGQSGNGGERRQVTRAARSDNRGHTQAGPTRVGLGAQTKLMVRSPPHATAEAFRAHYPITYSGKTGLAQLGPIFWWLC